MSDVASATEVLTERLRVEQLMFPGTAGYEEVVAIWNGAIENRPAVVVHCESTADVQAVVQIAGEFGLPLSVRVVGMTGPAARCGTTGW